MILEIFKDSLKYAFENKKSVFIIGILSLFIFLIIPIVFISGYLYRIVEIGLEGMINTEMLIATDKDLEFNNFKGMLIEGLKLIAITFIYSLIPILITNLFISSYNFIISNARGDILLNISLEIFLIILITGIIGFILINVAIPHMIKNESLKSGFKIKELIRIIKSVGIVEYILYTFASLIVLFSVSIISFLLIQLLTSILSSVLGLVAITSDWILMGIHYDLILYGLLMILIVFPLYLIFQTRAMALLYETNDLEEFEDE